MALTKCFDAALPPASVPDGAGAVLGYIGNHRLDLDFHIWTPQEWQPFAGLRQFPVWELNTSVGARESAQAAVAAMTALGWSPGRALVGAMETTIAPQWWDVFEDEVTNLHMVPVCYGSASTVFGNQAEHYWVARWDGAPVLEQGEWAHQYLSGGALDWSVLSQQLLHHGGIGPRTL